MSARNTRFAKNMKLGMKPAILFILALLIIGGIGIAVTMLPHILASPNMGNPHFIADAINWFARHAGAVLRLAKRDPKGAQDALRAAIAQLQAALTGPGSRATVTRLRRHNGKHDGAAPVALAA